MENEILHGQKQSGLNYSSMHSHLSLALRDASLSTETTEVSSKGGGTDAIATKQPTKYSNASTHSYNPYHTALKSHRSTSPAVTTQQTSHHAWAHLAHLTSYSHKSRSLNPYASSLSMRSHPPQQQNEQQPSITGTLPPCQNPTQPSRPASAPLPHRSQSSHTTQPSSSCHTPTPHSRFDTPIGTSSQDPPPPTPLPYRPDLHPKPSPHRPHCLAKDRLRLWLPSAPSPSNNTPSTTIISEEQLDRVLQVINQSWHDSTKATYGAGLLIFHVFCDNNDIPDTARCPALADLILAFVASCAGSYSGSTIANYVAGLKAWHTLHG